MARAPASRLAQVKEDDMAKKQTKSGRQRAVQAPKPKHVTIAPEQRLLIHVEQGGKKVAEYIAGADAAGVVTMYLAPEAAAPVQTPGSISGT